MNHRPPTTLTLSQPSLRPLPGKNRLRAGSCKRRVLLSAVLVLGLLLGALTAAGPLFADELPDLDDITSGTLFLRDEAGNYSGGLALNAQIGMTISGIVARVTLTQSFANSGPDWLEGLYVFPLPETAAVNTMSIQIGDRTVKGIVMEKDIGEAQYRQARDQGQAAGLVRQQRPNLFSMKIANIAPASDVVVTLHYIQTLEFHRDEISLRFPMTITPRFANADVSDAAALVANQFFPQQIPPPVATLKATLYAPGALQSLHSSSHELVLQQKDNTGVEISFNGGQPMDRDLQLSWSPARQKQPTVTSWIESTAEHDYLLAMVLPPQQLQAESELRRELILVVDTSGSMAGESIRAAKQALHAALDGLKSTDRFNLIEFNSSANQLFASPAPADSQHLDMARWSIDGLRADGGTEMQSALRLALANPTTAYLRQVVFITDGSVGNEEQLFAYIEQQLRDSRLFTVGIGSAPNSYFMRKAAQAGRGSFTSIDAAEQAEQKMSQLFLLLENPALTDIGIQWLGAAADYAPDPLADLYLGEPLLLSARLDPATRGFTISGRFGDTPWQTTVDLGGSEKVGSGLSTLWARQKIESLLDAQRRSADPDKYKNQISGIALEHELVSRYTSLVAIDSTPLRPAGTPLVGSQLATAMPAGSVNVMALPRGAAGSDTLLWLALASAIVALMCFAAQRRQGICGA